MRFYQASSWLLLVVLLGIVGCGGSDKGKDGAGDGSNAGTTSGKANTELQNQNLQSSNTPQSSATPDPANPKTTKSEPQIEKKATDKHVTPPNPTAPSPTSSIVVRHLKSESATVVYRFGGDPTEKAWTGPTGLSFMPDSKRLCVFGDSPFNAIISIPDKARLSSPNPSFDNRFEVTKISGYEWSPAIAANHLVDNLPLHDAAATLRHNLHNSWRTLGWHTCDVSKNGTYVAIGDRHKGRLEVVRVSDGKTVVSFDSSQYRPKPTDDRSTFGGGGSHTDNLQYAFSPDETKVALAVRTNSTPPRAFLAILETNSGALLQKIENFCPITMVFSPDSRTLATYYGRHSDYRSGGNPIDKGASKPGCIIRLLSTDDFTKQTDLVVEGSAQPVAFSKDGSILIAWDQGSGEDSASSSLLRAFDVGSGSQLWHQDLPQTLASHVYVHDDTRLFAGGFRRNKKNNSTCRVYCLDLRNGSPTLILEDAELWLYAVAPDGKTIATSSGRSQIKAWPIDAGEAVTTTKMATPTPKTPVIVGVEKPTTQEPKPTGVAVPPVSKDSPAIGTDVPPNVALAQESTPKPAVPDDAAQKAALALVADVYKPDYEKAKTPAQKLELAKKLLGEGIATKDDSASRFVLFRIARDIAAQQGDLVTAFDAIDRISTEFEADRTQMQVAAATTATKALKLPKDHQACAALLAPLIDEAIAVDRYDHAKSLAALTLGCAREGRDSALNVVSPCLPWAVMTISRLQQCLNSKRSQMR